MYRSRFEKNCLHLKELVIINLRFLRRRKIISNNIFNTKNSIFQIYRSHGLFVLVLIIEVEVFTQISLLDFMWSMSQRRGGNTLVILNTKFLKIVFFCTLGSRKKPLRGWGIKEELFYPEKKNSFDGHETRKS